MGRESSRARPLTSSDIGRNDRDGARHSPGGIGSEPSARRCPTALAVPGVRDVPLEVEGHGTPSGRFDRTVPGSAGSEASLVRVIPGSAGSEASLVRVIPGTPGDTTSLVRPIPASAEDGQRWLDRARAGRRRATTRDGGRAALSCRLTRRAGGVPGVLQSDRAARDAFRAVGGRNRASTDLLSAA
jgi:hypothetical protein